jgi:stearoyl-CoA desaturase (delta-9 desaturase)
MTRTAKNKPPLLIHNALVLTATPLVAAIAVPWYGLRHGYTWLELALFAFFMVATGLAITAGYHRLWTHRAYTTHALVRIAFALFGAAALQNCILRWSGDHRRHHRHVDQADRDPYAATKGFWFSHMGWILRSYPAASRDPAEVKDLMADPIVAWQHRYYLLLALTMNLALPLALGAAQGRLWGTFLLAGLLRLVLNHHFTFAINSLAHRWGRQTYDPGTTARDNPLLAFFTYGEGYHSFHHRFQADYRNGVRWYHFDPTKWLIRALAWLGLAHGLKRIPGELIRRAQRDAAGAGQLPTAGV